MPSLPAFAGFPKQALKFLTEPKRNNKTEWFQAHRDEYDRFVLFVVWRA